MDSDLRLGPKFHDHHELDCSTNFRTLHGETTRAVFFDTVDIGCEHPTSVMLSSFASALIIPAFSTHRAPSLEHLFMARSSPYKWSVPSPSSFIPRVLRRGRCESGSRKSMLSMQCYKASGLRPNRSEVEWTHNISTSGNSGGLPIIVSLARASPPITLKRTLSRIMSRPYMYLFPQSVHAEYSKELRLHL